MARINDTDGEWEKWGKKDPYFAVLTTRKYREGQNRDEFFQTGVAHFNSIRENFANRLGIPLDGKGTALDFGCGVGRVLKPMSSHFSSAVGVDVSPSMVKEAESQLDKGTVELRLYDGTEQALRQALGDDAFQFVHTRLVLQHIAPRRGLRILDVLLSHVEKGGKAFLDVPVICHNRLRCAVNRIRCIHPALYKATALLLLKPNALRDPVMQMNPYSAGKLLLRFAQHGFEVRWVRLETGNIGYLTNAHWYLLKT